MNTQHFAISRHFFAIGEPQNRRYLLSVEQEELSNV